MKIDVFYIWLVAFLFAYLFQVTMTDKKSEWDASYAVVDSDHKVVAHGQSGYTAGGTDLPWNALKQKVDRDQFGDTELNVVILGTNRRESYRVFRPFWREGE